MSSSKGYEHNRTWRLNHPDTRLAGKRRYYQKTSNAPNGKREWSLEDEQRVLHHDIPDSELSVILGRSVGAIQHKRTRLLGND